MRFILHLLLCICLSITVSAQQANSSILAEKPAGENNLKPEPGADNNIYSIKQHFLYNILHNPNDIDNEDDNELARFNRWFHDVEIRTYPSGNLPRPDILITESIAANANRAYAKKTTTVPVWQPVGPLTVPSNFNGIGRINAIVIDPVDTNTLYIGTACGGVFISHDGGTTWTSNSDNFPSLSIADIAVNPNHTDTIYAATGDGYGYTVDNYNNFWGGLYSGGVLRSRDGGATWHTTGLNYIQTQRQIIQKLLISPKNPNILLAATSNGIFRTTNAGLTWDSVLGGHTYSMAFRPLQPDTVYAICTFDLKVSYNAGATWSTLKAGLNPSNNRATIAVSPAAPAGIWVLDAANQLRWSHDAGNTFYTTNPPDTARFYGYYDRVLAVSPADSNFVVASGVLMAYSADGGNAWFRLDANHKVHADNHAMAINPLNASTIYSGNDGGIFVTHNGGHTWKNISYGLMISQIYRMSASLQNPYVMLCGVQDNGSMACDGTDWQERSGGDGQDCAINPANDFLQVSSSQNGYFYFSYDQGNSFTGLPVSTETANWTAPVVFDPNNEFVMYFGYKNIYCSNDAGGSFSQLSPYPLFTNGAYSLAVAPSNSNVLYAADYSSIFRSLDKGLTWTNITGNLPSTTVAITHIAVDYRDSARVYVSMSGYSSGNKVFVSATGGTSWRSISTGLPNLPVNCVVVDSTAPGALFAGTDMGVYYTDSAVDGWSLYGTGLPNVIANDIKLNYGNYKVRVATYGRGIWETNITSPLPNGVPNVSTPKTPAAHVYPNPTLNTWKLIFRNQRPASYTIRVTDVLGREIIAQQNNDLIDASSLVAGVYIIDVTGGGLHFSIKAVKE